VAATPSITGNGVAFTFGALGPIFSDPERGAEAFGAKREYDEAVSFHAADLTFK
jgi:hypothetical protein